MHIDKLSETSTKITIIYSLIDEIGMRIIDCWMLEVRNCVLRASSFHKSLWKYSILTSEFSN